MKRQIILLAAAAIALNGAPLWAQSVGGSQSERSGESKTPVSPDGTSARSEDPSKTQQSPRTGKDSSVGGTQSKRSGESATPVGEGRFGDPGKAGKSPGTASQTPGQSKSNRDTSIGGTQSKRSGESDTPVGQGRFGDPSKAEQGSRDISQGSGTSGQQDIRQAQEALKNQGHDPGPLDGVMGPQTRQALRAFQSSNGLKQTGMLDAETKQKLNIEDSSAKGSKPMRGEGSAPMGK